MNSPPPFFIPQIISLQNILYETSYKKRILNPNLNIYTGMPNTLCEALPPHEIMNRLCVKCMSQSSSNNECALYKNSPLPPFLHAKKIFAGIRMWILVWNSPPIFCNNSIVFAPPFILLLRGHLFFSWHNLTQEIKIINFLIF